MARDPISINALRKTIAHVSGHKVKRFVILEAQRRNVESHLKIAEAIASAHKSTLIRTTQELTAHRLRLNGGELTEAARLCAAHIPPLA